MTKKKNKKRKPNKQIDKKISIESPVDQYPEFRTILKKSDEMIEFRKLLRAFVENDFNMKEVIIMALRYYKNANVTKRDFLNLLTSLQTPSPNNQIPVILSSKMDAAGRVITKQTSLYILMVEFHLNQEILEKMIAIQIRSAKSCPFVKICPCIQPELFAVEASKLQYKLGCDYNSFFKRKPLLSLIQDSMRKAYRKKYYYLRRGLQIPEYLRLIKL